MSDLLKHQQEMHENNAKWNKAIEKIKKINFVKYKTNNTVRLIIDDCIKEAFISTENR
tara:strand:+ start:312 stop:485 length:174 start_codon:yes stop_codon:yes gene_type:complete